jgi:hypothetical protein
MEKKHRTLLNVRFALFKTSQTNHIDYVVRNTQSINCFVYIYINPIYS